MDKYISKLIDLLPKLDDYDPTSSGLKSDDVRSLIDDVTGLPFSPLLQASGPLISRLKKNKKQ